MVETEINVSRETLNEDIYWHWDRIKSYNCLFNFIVGSTGCGKGFELTKQLTKQAIYEGKQFAHIRRTDVELKNASKKFYNDMEDKNIFPSYHFRHIGMEYQYQELNTETNEPYDKSDPWYTAGYSLYLSGARVQKSIPMPKVWDIWFDEFILPNDKAGSYLPDEVTSFLRLYDTIARSRDVRVWFVSNAECLINPYFAYFDIHIPYKTSICRIKKDIAFEMVDNPAYKEFRRNTRFGQLIKGTDYESYAIDNKFSINEHSDICKLDANYSYFMGINYNGLSFGLYRSKVEEKVIISSKYDETKRPILEVKLINGKIPKITASQKRINALYNILFNYYIHGDIYYETVKVKQNILPLLNKLF